MRGPRRRLVNMGGFQAIKLGMPSIWDDLYYSTMEMGWASFVAAVSLAFVGINMVFGVLYALLPGAIDHMVAGSLLDGFFFSAETLGTVGYGNMAPATHVGHAVASFEILIGIFYSATVTGLIFARFARPRNSFVFSNKAVIGLHDGQRSLMVRLASTRARPLADVGAQMAWLETLDLGDGRNFRRLVDLPLVRRVNPLMGLAWMLIHPLDEESEMLAAWRSDDAFRLTVTVNGLDTLLAAPAFGGHSYKRDDIVENHVFVDAVDQEGSLFRLDLRKLNEITGEPGNAEVFPAS